MSWVRNGIDSSMTTAAMRTHARGVRCGAARAVHPTPSPQPAPPRCSLARSPPHFANRRRISAARPCAVWCKSHHHHHKEPASAACFVACLAPVNCPERAQNNRMRECRFERRVGARVLRVAAAAVSGEVRVGRRRRVAKTHHTTHATTHPPTTVVSTNTHYDDTLSPWPLLLSRPNPFATPQPAPQP